MQKLDYVKIFGIKKEDALNFGIVRKAFRSLMIKNSMRRQVRKQLNLSYLAALEKIFKEETPQLIKQICEGNVCQVQKTLIADRSLINKKYFDYPPLYYAVRSGHYDLVELIIKMGCSLDFQGHKSTPMHCASYYGHYQIIPLLLQYGVPTHIKNICESIPIQQAATPEIKQLLQKNNQNVINILNQHLLEKKIGYTMLNIIKNSKIVAKKIILNKYIDGDYKNFFNAFHGTSFKNLQSIAEYGLRKPGEIVGHKKIDVVGGHIPLGLTHIGIKNWSNAVFVSPSIYYAAHPVYSKQVISQRQTWLPLVQVKVKKGTFTQHDHTLKTYSISTDEPTDLQWRVEFKQQKDGKDLIMRVEKSQQVHVVAILLVKKGFLDDYPDYLETTELILNSPEEKKLRLSLKM